MVLAFDFDDTITADPVLFAAFAKAAQDAGHTAVVCTFRAEPGEVPDTLRAWGIDAAVYCTGGAAKRDFMDREGLLVDVWVDDWPDLIVGAGERWYW